jgi:hypothetical protein
MAAFIPYDNANSYRMTAMKVVEGKDLTDRIIVITGANGALGKEMRYVFVLPPLNADSQSLSVLITHTYPPIFVFSFNIVSLLRLSVRLWLPQDVPCRS